jgi:GH24 family phage-related lysozyme (muramidase)
LALPGPTHEVDDQLQSAVAVLPDPFPPLTAAGVTFIARQEVTDASRYRQSLERPCWPDANSGITIGIGYDCSAVTPDQLRSDWRGQLGADALTQLCGAARRVGSDALVTQLNSVVIPLVAAMRVFTATSLPKYLSDARSAFPQIDQLPPAQRTALVSLVYNRGARLTDRRPDKRDREEMRNIRSLLAVGDLGAVPAQFESMTRLWDPAKDAGIIRRRSDEAALWRSGFTAVKLE